MKYLLGLLLISTIAFGAYIPKNFTKAKEMSVRLYYTHHMTSFYTDSEMKPIVYIGKKKFPYKSTLILQLGLINSPYTGSKYVARGQKIEWEHIVPASWFVTVNEEIRSAYEDGDPRCVTSKGKSYKGRKCAEKVSVLFNKMEADMYNLVPVIGALNAMRIAKPYSIIDGEAREFGDTIDVEITTKFIEVMPSKRGNIARIMKYMNKKYGVTFPNHIETINMLDQWDTDDVEDDWELKKKEILNKTYGMEF